MVLTMSAHGNTWRAVSSREMGDYLFRVCPPKLSSWLEASLHACRLDWDSLVADGYVDRGQEAETTAFTDSGIAKLAASQWNRPPLLAKLEMEACGLVCEAHDALESGADAAVVKRLFQASGHALMRLASEHDGGSVGNLAAVRGAVRAFYLAGDRDFAKLLANAYAQGASCANAIDMALYLAHLDEAATP